MSGPRYQTGHVTRRNRHWRGEYHTFRIQPDGSTKRIHKSANLGLRSETTKTQAKKKLADIISREVATRPDSSVRLRWFVENKFLPVKKASWKASTAGTAKGTIERQILIPLGDRKLGELDRTQLQMHLNTLAERKYGYTTIQHTASFLLAIFDEAVELGYLERNPARKLQIPRIQKEKILGWGNQDFSDGKVWLTKEQLRTVLSRLEGRDRLIVMLAAFMALRGGEVFALQWGDYDGDKIHVMRRVYRGKLDEPKTEASNAFLPVPHIVKEALDKWKERCETPWASAFIFQSKNHTPLDKNNWLRRVLSLAIACDNLPPEVNFWVFRRTWTTHAPEYDAQLKEMQSVMRHSKSNKNITVEVYQQALPERMRRVMDAFADDVAADLPEHAEPAIKVEESDAIPVIG